MLIRLSAWERVIIKRERDRETGRERGRDKYARVEKRMDKII